MAPSSLTTTVRVAHKLLLLLMRFIHTSNYAEAILASFIVSFIQFNLMKLLLLLMRSLHTSNYAEATLASFIVSFI